MRAIALETHVYTKEQMPSDKSTTTTQLTNENEFTMENQLLMFC